MKTFILALVLVSEVAITSLSEANELRIPLNIIESFFDRNQDGREENIPFNVRELESFFSHFPAASNSEAARFTKKYLSLSYPKGEISIGTIIHANIPEVSKELILSAPSENVLIKAHLNDLWQVPSNYIKKISSSGAALAVGGVINVSSLLSQASKYQSNLYFSTYVRILDAKNREYLLSTPSSEHIASLVLDATKKTELILKFVVSDCDNEKCFSSNGNGVVASFAINPFRLSQIRVGAALEVKCRYDAIYRREYSDHREIEVVFNNCQLLSENGRKPAPVPKLFEKLYTQ